MSDAQVTLIVLGTAFVLGSILRVGLILWWRSLPKRWGESRGLELIDRKPCTHTKPPSAELTYRSLYTGQTKKARMIIPGWWTVHIVEEDSA